jgi:arabinogalactan oligomer/maltooligosaccharide transport system permease protein
MRKILLLMCAFAASALVGCGSDRDKTIMIWTQMVPAERRILDEKLADFATRHPEYADYKFKELYYETEQVRTNFMIAALGGSGAELVYGPSDNTGPFVKLGVIQPMEDMFDKTYLDGFISDPVKANTYLGGHLYQMADQVGNHLCLVYNKDLIAEPPKTMSELIKFGVAFTKDLNGDGKIDQYGLAWNYTEPYFFVPFIGGYGGSVMNDKNEPTLNTDATIKAAQLIKDLRDKYKIIPRECDYDIANTLFKEGKAAMIINGPWSWAGYKDSHMNFGIARIPMIDETGLYPAPMVSPRGYSVNVNVKGEKRKVIADLLKFLTSTDVMLDFTKRAGTIPARKEAFDKVSQMLEQEVKGGDPKIANDNAILRGSLLQISVGRAMPVVSEMRVIWDSMRPNYQAVLGGSTDAKDAAKNMQDLAVKLIKEMNE